MGVGEVPIDQAGSNSGFLDVAAMALMRGRNGMGVRVVVVTRDVPAGVVLGPLDREAIVGHVDTTRGPDAHSVVASQIAQLLHDRIRRV